MSKKVQYVKSLGRCLVASLASGRSGLRAPIPTPSTGNDYIPRPTANSTSLKPTASSCAKSKDYLNQRTGVAAGKLLTVLPLPMHSAVLGYRKFASDLAPKEKGTAHKRPHNWPAVPAI